MRIRDKLQHKWKEERGKRVRENKVKQREDEGNQTKEKRIKRKK